MYMYNPLTLQCSILVSDEGAKVRECPKESNVGSDDSDNLKAVARGTLALHPASCAPLRILHGFSDCV